MPLLTPMNTSASSAASLRPVCHKEGISPSGAHRNNEPISAITSSNAVDFLIIAFASDSFVVMAGSRSVLLRFL